MKKIRPEFVQASEHKLCNAILEPTWPADISRLCPSCNAELHPKINLSYGHGKAGRACLVISHWITLPWALLCLILGPALLAAGGNGGGFALGLLMLVPAVVFAVVARLCPMTRRVQCFRCNHSHDYTMLSQPG